MKTIALVMLMLLVAVPAVAFQRVTIGLNPEYADYFPATPERYVQTYPGGQRLVIDYINCVSWFVDAGFVVFVYADGSKRVYPASAVLFVEGP